MVNRSIYEGGRDLAREIAQSAALRCVPAGAKKIEMLFAQLRRTLGLGRLRYESPAVQKDEFLLAATARNLRKLASCSRFLSPLRVEESYLSFGGRTDFSQADFFNSMNSSRACGRGKSPAEATAKLRA